MRFGLTREESEAILLARRTKINMEWEKRHAWHKWFAWYPVSPYEGYWVWLETVDRRCTKYSSKEYRLIDQLD